MLEQSQVYRLETKSNSMSDFNIKIKLRGITESYANTKIIKCKSFMCTSKIDHLNVRTLTCVLSWCNNGVGSKMYTLLLYDAAIYKITNIVP